MTLDQAPITEESWKRILANAVPILDDLESRHGSAPALVLGGGTVLMLRFRHRLSRDVDFFLSDVQWLSLLTPRLNDVAARLSLDYHEQANSVKLVTREGDIDFIVASSVTQTTPQETISAEGRHFLLDTTEEILAKKLFHRAALLKPRDVFDLVCVHALDPAAAERAVKASSTRRPQLLRRLDDLAKRDPQETGADILPLGIFSDMTAGMIEVAYGLIAKA